MHSILRAAGPLLIAAAASGQRTPAVQPRGEIRGLVVSADTRAPIVGARIELSITGTAGTTDSVRRVVTGTDGRFRVQALRPGAWRLRVSSIGFSAREVAQVTVGPAAPVVDAGTVALTPAAVELGAVAIRDRQAAVDLAPDRNAYVVHDMPTTRGGTALDVLRNVPAVDVDIDNVVSLRGNSGVIVQINGRASPMKGSQLGDFLAQLPADVVTTVEVVSNPSAREDATGAAGIINIVLRQETDAGTSGGVSVGMVTTGTENLGGSYGYDRGPLAIFASYGLINDRRSRTEGVVRDNFVGAQPTYLDESGLRFQKPLMHTVSGSATYAFGKHDELSTDLLFSTRTEPETFDVRYTTLDAARRVSGLTGRYTDGLNHESSLESSLTYKHAFADKGHRISADLRFNQGPEGGPTGVTQHTLAPDGTRGALTDQEKSTPWSHPSDGDLTIAYARPLSKLLRFEAGYKGSLQQFHSTLDTRVLDTARGVFVPDSTRIADNTFDQWVHAAYGMLSAQLGQFTVQGGVRLEHASTTFRLRSTGASYDNAYSEAYPSGLVIFHLDDARELKLSYSTRINRPDDSDVLDPTPRILDPLNIRVGNPYLQPEIIRAVELGFQQTKGKVTLQVTPYFRRTFNAVRNIRTIDTAGVTTQSYANIATSNASGLDVTLAMAGSRVSGFAGASAYREVSNASNVATGLSVNTFGWTGRTNVSLRVSKEVDAQALVTYQAPMDVVQGRNGPRTRVSFAARRKFADDRLAVTVRVLDPFNMALEESKTIDPMFTQISDRKRDIRGFGLALSWMFGKPQKDANTDLIGEPPGE